MFKLMPVLLLCTFAVGSYAQAPRPGAAWFEAGHVLLGMTEPAVGVSGSWQFDRANNGDMRIVKDEQRVGTPVNGTLMVICDDAAMLTKGLTPVKGREMREIDGPILLLQLALRLLERGVPQGPQSVNSETMLDVSENVTAIRVRRGSAASSEFLPPWRLRGKVSRLAQDKIQFEMKFAYSTLAAKDRQFDMDLVGLWQKESRVAVFENEMSIADWPVYRMDSVTKTVAGNVLVDRIAAPYPRRFTSLGDLRAMIEHNWDPRSRARRNECKLQP